MNPADLMTLTYRALQTPALRRGSMTPRPWTGFWAVLSGWLRLAARPAQTDGVPSPSFSLADQRWMKVARVRRQLFLLLTLGGSATATWLFAMTQSPLEHPLQQGLQIGLFALLSFWVGAGVMTAVMGFWVQWRSDPYALNARAVRNQLLDPAGRTALIMPICNEQVSTVFAGLRATCESLSATGQQSQFDVFVLSDTNDPVLRTQELAAWARLRQDLPPQLMVYYRWRQRRTRRKAGNVADFCRRWGRNYRYMVVLDADSVMSGTTLVGLAQLMEAHPSAGIIQTVPRACGVDTLHAQAQQFGSRFTGRLFTLGMQYWQLGESHYWGHNAIIRMEPFMRHCALALLPGKGGLSGEILSHDFIEASLMRRAGYFTWLVSDLKGSFEQQPSNLREELQRDRRWCQGNLKNGRLLLEPGLAPVHRALIATGVMAYLSAPLWLLFLLNSLALGWSAGARAPGGNWWLWPTTLGVLFLPRLLALASAMVRGEAPFHGGLARMGLAFLSEAGLSSFQAPLRMLAHTMFVISALTGLDLEWKSPARTAAAISWSATLDQEARVSALAWGAFLTVALLHPETLLWILPVGLPLALAPALAVFTSRPWRPAPGLGLAQLFRLPEERHPPSVLRQAWHYSAQPLARPASVPVALLASA